MNAEEARRWDEEDRHALDLIEKLGRIGWGEVVLMALIAVGLVVGVLAFAISIVLVVTHQGSWSR